MQKLTALILSVIFILSLTACGGKNTAAKSFKPEKVAVESETPQENTETSEIVTPDETFEDVKSFDDFVEKLDKNGYSTTVTQNDDGSVSVDLNTPTSADDTATPAIPTIDTLPRPVKPETPITEPTTPTPEIEKPEEPEQTPEEEPEDEPEQEIEQPDTAPEKEKDEEKETVTPPETPKKEDPKPQYTYTSNQKHTKVPYTERYLYSVLDEEKKGWYEAIDKAVTNLEARAEINVDLAVNNNYYIYYLYMFDNPEHFYLGNQVTIYNYGGDKDALVFCYSDGKLTCRFGGELKEINDELRTGIIAKKAIFDKEVERIISTIPADAPDVVKEKLIYDRILLDSHYNLSAKWNGIAEDNWTAFGIIVNKMGVCESYSEAFQTLCLAVGINCTGVVGTAGGGHKWNCVMLDNEWYMCDITFDDPIGGREDEAYHYFFNLTSEQMIAFNHDWSDSRWPVPECTATKYSYHNYFEA